MESKKITSLREVSLDRRVKLPRTTLDHYNDMGLLMPPMQKLGKMYLYYEDDLIKRIVKIKQLKENGHTLKDIKKIIENGNNLRTNKEL